MPKAVGLSVAVSWLLAGCSTLSSINPVNWWHREQGGKIAEQRPAPPGADQPYPNLATVPAKPEAPDAEALKKLTDSLVADRTNAQHAAQSSPLSDPSSPTASPSLFGVGTAPAPPPPGTPRPPTAAGSGTSVASASMPAVNAPPAPAAPPVPAPRKAVQSTPLGSPSVDIPSAETQSAPTGAAPTGAAPTASSPGAPTIAAGTPPALPVGPPTRPNAAPAPPVAPAAVTPMPAPSAGPSAAIVFTEGAAALSAPAADEVKAFAAKRGNGTIAVTGYGDSASSDPDAQSAAVNLGLSRAQSIVEALKAAGVPGNAIRVSAEASGRGASLHLLQ